MNAPGYVALEPAAWLRRSARVFGDRVAVIDDDVSFTYAQFDERVDRMVGALRALGVRPGDRVAVLSPNTHVMLALHYALPRIGAPIVALNIRLSAPELAGILEHAGPRSYSTIGSSRRSPSIPCARAAPFEGSVAGQRATNSNGSSANRRRPGARCPTRCR